MNILFMDNIVLSEKVLSVKYNFTLNNKVD